jgi:hydroxyacylglutathione hydrolase
LQPRTVGKKNFNQTVLRLDGVRFLVERRVFAVSWVSTSLFECRIWYQMHDIVLLLVDTRLGLGVSAGRCTGIHFLLLRGAMGIIPDRTPSPVRFALVWGGFALFQVVLLALRGFSWVRGRRGSGRAATIPAASGNGNTATERVRVVALPELQDNLAYAVSFPTRSDPSKTALLTIDCVDPGRALRCVDAGTVLGAVSHAVTHHHWDHAGGLPEARLRSWLTSSTLAELPRFLGTLRDASRWPPLSALPSPGDTLQEDGASVLLSSFDEGVEGTTVGVWLTPLHTPSHTRGSTSFRLDVSLGDRADHVERVIRRLLFTGDTLFVGGCGKFFEGTAADFVPSIRKIYASCSGAHTELLCGHDYGRKNFAWAKGFLEDASRAVGEASAKYGSESGRLLRKLDDCARDVKRGAEWHKECSAAQSSSAEPTQPPLSSLEDERGWNLFVRAALGEDSEFLEAVTAWAHVSGVFERVLVPGRLELVETTRSAEDGAGSEILTPVDAVLLLRWHKDNSL